MKQTFRSDALHPILNKYQRYFGVFTTIYSIFVLLLTNFWKDLPTPLRLFIWDNLSEFINNLAVYILGFLLIGIAITLSILRVFFEQIRAFVYPKDNFNATTTTEILGKKDITSTSGDSNIESHVYFLSLTHPVSQCIIDISVSEKAYHYFEKDDMAIVKYNAENKHILYLVFNPRLTEVF
jgi:hypothetical protein